MVRRCKKNKRKKIEDATVMLLYRKLKQLTVRFTKKG